jgi:hypothetical protein
VHLVNAVGKERTDPCSLVWTAMYGLGDREVSPCPLV